jgi:L-fuculose-phosphate aldolase
MSRTDLVNAYRRMHADGLIQGTAGNVSVRTGPGMLLTPSSLQPAQMHEDDVCEFHLDTGLVAGERTPSTEWKLHLRIYQGSDAGAIVHTHSLAATAVSLVAAELPAVHYYIARLGGPVPVVPYAVFGSVELAESVAAALQERQAAILENHGAVTVGRTLDEALDRATLLEWLCELYLKAAAVGSPHALSADDLAAVRGRGATIAAEGYCCG